MSKENQQVGRAKASAASVESKPAERVRGSIVQKEGFAGVTLGPKQVLPNAAQAMTPASPPAATAPTAASAGETGQTASSGEQ